METEDTESCSGPDSEPTDTMQPLLCWTDDVHSQTSGGGEFIDEINATNAKKLALLLVITLIGYHGIIHWAYGRDSCKWILSDGRFKGDMAWQPYGCMMHQYSQVDTKKCMKYLSFWDHNNDFLYIGDARVYDLFATFVQHFNPNYKRIDVDTASAADFTDTLYTNENLNLKAQFVWSPYIGELMYTTLYPLRTIERPPSMIVMGCGTYSMQQYNTTALDHVSEYATNLSRLVQSMDILSERKTRVIWNLQESVNEKTLSSEYEMITNQVIDAYNKAAIETLSHSDVTIWSSSRLIASGRLSDMRHGLFVHPKCLDIDVQLLLNVYCNDHMNFNDATCCATPEQHSSSQVVVYTAFLICIILTCILTLKQSVKFLYEEPTHAYIVISSLGKLGLILTYFYLCDRTNFFMKENKYYSQVSFWLPIGYVFVLGVFFTEDSRYIKILNRDQTDEWKGCMQLILVISHMTGARTQLSILNHMRIFASSYLFLSGFGHFYYMWHRPDSGLARYLQVLFRLNALTVLCCVAMNRPYQFYYFVPLVTFWFSLLYLVLQAPPRGNGTARYLYMGLKLLALSGLTAVLYISEVFFEKIFVTRPWKALFVTTDDDIHDWWMRWKLDRYSFLYGCVFSLCLILVQKFNLIDDNTYSNLFSTKLTLVSLFIALIALCLNSTFAMLCSEAECTELHSYTVIVPILSYIVIRNISGRLRTRYSSLFTGLGRISLELYITQSHIFTAADTHGILTLLPEYPVLNSLLTCFIFICVAHELHEIMLTLMPYCVPQDSKTALRNFLIFLFIFIPLGVCDGMF
uniref:CAS1 domain-containing protein 1 n=1 Tax=Cacopsylla melanoneura TaxID=428564 RepID=A0A8D8UXD8_9HEMI